MNDMHYPSNIRRPFEADRAHPPFRIGYTLLAVLPVLMFLAGASPTTAQSWQYVYGPNTSVDIEIGKRGVRPTSLNCTGVMDGYIAVGTTTTLNHDLYVVRTDNTGATTPGWERMYDVFTGSEDHGESITELSDGTGFVVVGYSDAGGDFDILVMKIACDGSEIWKNTYGTSGIHEYGYDIIEATGGGFYVAGRRALGATNEDAILMHVLPGGGLNWLRTYDQGISSIEWFNSLTEVTQVSGPLPDVIAVGLSGPSSGAGRRGYVVRTNAGGNWQSTGTYSGGVDEEFHSVIELQNPGQIGSNGRPNVVMAGRTASYSLNQDMYFVKLDGGDPCQPLVQRIVGHTPANEIDVATCIREITFVPSVGYQQWDLAVSGYARDPSSFRDMAFIALGPATLVPIGPGWLYGHVDNDEEGWSIFPVPAGLGRTDGFVLCGLTETPWHTPNPIDPGDLYLVKNDNQTAMGACENPYTPTQEEVAFDVGCPPTIPGSTGSDASWFPADPLVDWDDLVCTDASNDGYPKRIGLSDKIDSRLSSRPNPLNHNQPLVLVLNGFNSEHGLTLSVTNSLGEEIASQFDQFTPSTGEILMKTTGWPAGVYHITVLNGERTWTTRVVVLE